MRLRAWLQMLSAGGLIIALGLALATDAPWTREPLWTAAADVKFDTAARFEAIGLGLQPSGASVRVIRLADGSERGLYRGHDAAVTDAQFLADGQAAVSGDRKGRLALWSTRTLQTLRSAELRSPVTGLNAAPDGRAILTGTATGGASLLTLTDGRFRPLGAPDDRIWAVGFAPVGSYLFTASWNKGLDVWTGRGGHVQRLAWPGGTPVFAAFSPRGDQIIAVTTDGRAFVWRKRREPGILGRLARPAWWAVGLLAIMAWASCKLGKRPRTMR